MSAVTATCSLAIGGVMTVGAPSGGSIEIGMNFTNAAISQPQAPAVVVQSQLTGASGQAGTYQTNLSQLITSSTFTFILMNTAQNSPNNGAAPLPFSTAKPPPIIPNVYGLVPPPPLPQSLIGSANQTSYGF